jgi:chorismate mutase/prephenate dehydratase
MSEQDDIENLRLQIDELDQKLLGLVNKRIELAKQVGIVKNVSQDNTVYRPDREANILSRLSEINKGPLEAEQVQTIFREIISISRAAESRPSVAFLGPEGTYSELAVKKHFGSEVKHIFCDSIEETFQSVETRQAQHGVVPVENSTEGGVSNTLNCLVTTPITIVGEITLRISHALLGNVATNESIKTVLGHKQALAQCRLWLDQHLPGSERLAVSSNAEAARQASLDDDCVAIAGIEAGDVYGLKIIRKGIEDEPNNSTRFLVISNQLIEPSGRDKISLLLASRNKAGSLHRLLTPLSDNGISMTRIESRPSRMGLWEYIFFIDLEGHVNDKNVQNALEIIEKEAALFKILGCYPRAA